MNLPKKKIVLITGHLGIGGSEKSLISFLDYMDYDRYECHLLILEDRDELVHLVNPNVKIHYISKNSPYFDTDFRTGIKNCLKDRAYLSFYYLLLYTLFKHIKTEFAKRMVFSFKKRGVCHKDKYDIAIAYDSFCKKYLIKRINADYKIVRQSNGNFTPKKKDIKLFEKCDRIVTLTESGKELLNSNYNIPNEKISVIQSNFNDNEIKEKADEFKAERKTSLVFSETQRMIPLKNIEMIIAGMKYLYENITKDFTCYIIGGPDGDGEENRAYFEELKKAAEPLGDRIVFTGPLENPYPYVKASDIFLQSSDTESWARSITEALILGVPVLSTDTVGGKKQIIPGTNGELCRIRDTEDFCKKLVYMTEHIKDIREKMPVFSADNRKIMKKWYRIFENEKENTSD